MWTRLSGKTEWQAYVLATAKTLQIPQEQLAWGNGPQTYPCLVASHMPPPVPGSTPRIYSAFVYPADAEALLGPRSSPAAQAALATVLPTQDKFNRWLTAQMLTVTHFLVATGICKEDQFEEKMLEFIEKVDLWKKDQNAEIRERLGKLGTKIIERLDSAI